MVAGARRRARWYALQVLYALDVSGGDPRLALATYWKDFDVDVDQQAIEFAESLVLGTHSHLAQIDDLIQSASRNWRLERMSRVDRNILRLAAYELTECDEVPLKVVINEGVELAKRFGAAQAPAFVNGILDRIAQGKRGSEPE